MKSIRFRLSNNSVYTISSPQNSMTFWGTVLLCLSVALPIINAFPTVIRYCIPAAGLLLFFLGVLKDKAFLQELFFTLLIVFFINSFAYYHVYGRYYLYRGFIIRSLECWLLIMLALYYIKSKDYISKRYLSTLILLITVITSITSLIYLPTYPYAVRGLDNGGKDFAEGLEHILYSKNMATWGLCFAITFMLPTLIYLFKKEKKVYWLAIIGIFEFFILRSQIMFAILISVLFLIFLFISPPSPKYSIFIIFGLIIIFIFMDSFLDDLLLYFYSNISDTSGLHTIKQRIYQLYISVSTGVAVGDVKARFNLYSSSWKVFLEHPILGWHDTVGIKFQNVGLHSQILDLLASVGLIGFIPLAFLFYNKTIRLYNDFSDSNTKKYLFLTISILCVLMFLNPVYHSPSIFMGAFLFPALITNDIK